MDAGVGPEGWAIKLTRMLDQVYGNGSGRYPVDVTRLALEYSANVYSSSPIKKIVSDALDGFEGALVPAKKSGAWGIFYDNRQRPERARFTIAHEFGHYLLHRHLKPEGFWCGEEQVSRREGVGIEKEADTFAAYLLMPFHDFRDRIAPNHKPSLDELGACARRYGVSLTAAIIRWLEYTERRSLFVVSREGFALWAKASDPAFKSGRFIKTRNKVYALPELARCAVGPMDAENRNGIHHPAGVWFDEPVEEMSIASEDLDMVLTLLHLGPVPERRWDKEIGLEGVLKDSIPNRGR